MSEKKVTNKESVHLNLLFSSTGSRLLTVLSVNIVVVGLFGIIGYYLDMYFDTKPIFLFALIVISFPVSIIFIIKKARLLADKLSK